MKNKVDVWFDKHFWTIGQITSWYDEGAFITNDPKYNIPQSISDNISDDDLELMFYGGLINLYGVQDENGYVHINEHDYQVIKKFSDVDNDEHTYEHRKRMNLPINCIFIDWKSDEDLKLHFFERILK